MEPRAQAALAGAIVAWASAFAGVKALLDAGFAGEDVALARYAVALRDGAASPGVARVREALAALGPRIPLTS